MISIARGARPSIKVFSRKTVKALDGSKVTKFEQELEKATRFFTNPENFADETKLTRESFSFEVYRDPEVQDALGRIFGTKCAYCETDFGAVTPKDIEHFRPKSEITTSDGTLAPGYYWLAGEWDNLLVSCPDCNRNRAHEMPGETEKVTLGKQAQFPLSTEQHRVREKGSLVREEAVRLLLNPCLDKPEEHLTFDTKGLVHARVVKGVTSPMGDKSITVYALQRKPLVERRLRILNSFRLLFDQLNQLVKNQNELTRLGASQSVVEGNLVQIGKVRDGMQAMVAPKSEYLAMLRGWIDAAHGAGECERLLQFGIDLRDLIGNTNINH